MGLSPLIFTTSSSPTALGQAGDSRSTGLVTLTSSVAIHGLAINGHGMLLPQLTRDDTGTANWARAPQVYAGGGFNGY